MNLLAKIIKLKEPCVYCERKMICACCKKQICSCEKLTQGTQYYAPHFNGDNDQTLCCACHDKQRKVS